MLFARVLGSPQGGGSGAPHRCPGWRTTGGLRGRGEGPRQRAPHARCCPLLLGTRPPAQGDPGRESRHAGRRRSGEATAVLSRRSMGTCWGVGGAAAPNPKKGDRQRRAREAPPKVAATRRADSPEQPPARHPPQRIGSREGRGWTRSFAQTRRGGGGCWGTTTRSSPSASWTLNTLTTTPRKLSFKIKF